MVNFVDVDVSVVEVIVSTVARPCSTVAVRPVFVRCIATNVGHGIKLSDRMLPTPPQASSTMGDYMQKLGVADKANKPTKDNPGTFFLDTAQGQVEVR